MSTIPTPTSASLYQIPSASASSSRRTSLDTANRSSTISSPALQPTQVPPAQPLQARRNRAALRDYYGLKDPPAQHPGTQGNASVEAEPPTEAHVANGELDAAGFDVQAYVKDVLDREGLEGVLRVEGSLVNEIKSLDGDRKALVYDNYSKLITATDTIHRMRANMDPLAPTTSTLAPAIAHIAGTAEGLATTMKERVGARTAKEHVKRAMNANDKASNTGGAGQAITGEYDRRKEANTVKWVLGASARYRSLINQGDKEAAEKDWRDVRLLLKNWQDRGVSGTLEITKECASIMEASNSS